MDVSEIMEKALNQPNGARYYRCALQVNPYEYLIRHRINTPYKDESGYNAALIQAFLEEGIEVIALTDHYRVKPAQGLINAAKEAGIYVFPGFEAVTKDSVHFLCFLDLSASLDLVQAKISDCGIHDDNAPSPSGKYSARDLMEESRKWGNAICLAAHVTHDGGLLRTLTAQARVSTWKDPNLLACAIPGSVADTPDNLRPILENKNSDYKRDRPLAIVNANDVSDPSDVKKPGSSCWIKMSTVSVEGLRQAFLDPDSRIRLTSDPPPEDHTKLVAIAWEGGFLDGASLHFNENLNALIGGRGTGKSTVIESLRYVLQLDPIGADASKAHEGIIKEVLKNGTKISLLVRSHRPDKRNFMIERTVPNPPVVKDESGNVLHLTPQDILPHFEIFGQHEISELAQTPEKLTLLLERFMDTDTGLSKRKSELQRELEKSRERILNVRRETKRTEEQSAKLPALEETLKRYQDAKLEEKLKDQSLLVQEERILKTADERIKPFKEILDTIRSNLPVDVAFVSETALKRLPAFEILKPLHTILRAFDQSATTTAGNLETEISKGEVQIAGVRSQWNQRKSGVQEAYEKILRELQKSKIDGEEFLKLRRQIEELRPLNERIKLLQRNEKEYNQHRRNLLTEWEDTKRQEFQRLEKAAKKVSRQLRDRVRIQVEFTGNREPLYTLLRDQVDGRFKDSLDILKQKPDLSLVVLAETCRKGREELVRKYSIPSSQADRLIASGESTFMKIEEIDLPSTVRIELNVAPEGQPPEWKALDDLSKGQKATAVLLLLLLESDIPLVVDQPEDDLDNRFITEGIVPTMREEKRKRQFIFATHNANIPVLGDAELILGLKAVGEAGMGRAEISSNHMGSIDCESVRELVEEILEGGKSAFETRRLKYGFY